MMLKPPKTADAQVRRMVVGVELRLLPNQCHTCTICMTSHCRPSKAMRTYVISSPDLCAVPTSTWEECVCVLGKRQVWWGILIKALSERITS
jgi:hypothetical protein